VKEPPTIPLVNRDSVTRRARRLAVQFDVGELGFVLSSVRNREAVPTFNFHWHHACYGWRVEFIFARARQPIMASNHRWRSPFRGSRRESAVAHLPKDVQGTVVRPPCPHNFSNLLNCPSGQRDDEIGQ